MLYLSDIVFVKCLERLECFYHHSLSYGRFAIADRALPQKKVLYDIDWRRTSQMYINYLTERNINAAFETLFNMRAVAPVVI